MRASELVDKLIESDADNVDPKDYLRTVEPVMLNMAIRRLVIASVDDMALDSRTLVSNGLQMIGVDPHVADLIALEQGSSQAYVNRSYLKQQGLTGRLLRDATEFIKVAYDIEADEDLLHHLYTKYVE